MRAVSAREIICTKTFTLYCNVSWVVNTSAFPDFPEHVKFVVSLMFPNSLTIKSLHVSRVSNIHWEDFCFQHGSRMKARWVQDDPNVTPIRLKMKGRGAQGDPKIAQKRKIEETKMSQRWLKYESPQSPSWPQDGSKMKAPIAQDDPSIAPRRRPGEPKMTPRYFSNESSRSPVWPQDDSKMKAQGAQDGPKITPTWKLEWARNDPRWFQK